MKISYQRLNFLAGLLCGFYLIAAYLLQHYQHLLPCPLCVLQRWVIMLLILFFFAGSLYTRTRCTARIHAFFTFLIATIGVLLSSRHLWLLNHPVEETGNCAPSLQYLFKQLPFAEAIKTLFLGSGDCATMGGSFLGMSIPFWTLWVFLSLACLSVWQMRRKNP